MTEVVIRDCELKWCKSGDPASQYASENIGDGCFSILICRECFNALRLKSNGSDIPEADKVERVLRKHYSEADK